MKGKIIFICAVVIFTVIVGAIHIEKIQEAKRTDANVKELKEELWEKKVELAHVKKQLEESDDKLYEIESKIPQLVATSEDADVALKILEKSTAGEISSDLSDVEKLRELFKKNALDDT